MNTTNKPRGADFADILATNSMPDLITVVSSGKVKTAVHRPGMTLAEVFEETDFKIGEDQSVRVNGKDVQDFDLKMNPGDQVMVIEEVSGA